MAICISIRTAPPHLAVAAQDIGPASSCTWQNLRMTIPHGGTLATELTSPLKDVLKQDKVYSVLRIHTSLGLI